jgi:hypothetical protein
MSLTGIVLPRKASLALSYLPMSNLKTLGLPSLSIHSLSDVSFEIRCSGRSRPPQCLVVSST